MKELQLSDLTEVKKAIMQITNKVKGHEKQKPFNRDSENLNTLTGRQGSKILAELVRQSGYFFQSGATNNKNDYDCDKVQQTQVIAKNIQASCSQKIKPPQAKHLQVANTLPSSKVKASLKMQKSQTHFGHLVNFLKSSCRVSKIQQQKRFLKLDIGNSCQDFTSAYRQQLLKEKRTKQEQKIQMSQSTCKTKQAQRLKQHLQKGPSFKYTFDQAGQILLFRSRPLTPSYLRTEAQQTFYIRPQASKRLSKHPQLYQKSSKSQPSTVLTKRKIQPEIDLKQSNQINSMTATKRSISSSANTNIVCSQPSSLLCQDSQSLSQRKKLYNNNGKRQTSNVPFFKAERGTDYVEINIRGNSELKNRVNIGDRRSYLKQTRSASSFKFKHNIGHNWQKSVEKQITRKEEIITQQSSLQQNTETKKLVSADKAKALQRIKTQNLDLLQTFFI